VLSSVKGRQQPLIRVVVPAKRCGVCQLVKPAAEFDASQRSVDGLAHTCKDCKLRQQRQRRQQQRQQRASMQQAAGRQ
jgi:hypothetical protein